MDAPAQLDRATCPATQERSFTLISDSACFRKAPALRALLIYLWRHRGESVNEYLIATECLGRKADFDPKVDATVRVHVARARQKLKEFYAAEGASCPLRLSIPLGGHELRILDPQAPVTARKPLPAVAMLAGLSILLALACAWLAWDRHRVSKNFAGVSAERALPRFWRDFFANGKPAAVFLPTPVFFEWKNNNLKVRDILVNDFADAVQSPLLAPLVAKLGPPVLMQNYTAVSDTFAALKLAQYLERKGITLSVGATADLSLDRLGDRNIILLGTATTSFHIHHLMEKTNFYSRLGESRIVRSRNPAAGEPAQYEEVRPSDSRRTTPGVIALLPGPSGGTQVLALCGLSTSSLVSFLESATSLDLFDRMWQKAGSPSHFEVLVEAEIEGSSVLRARPHSLRPVTGKVW